MTGHTRDECLAKSREALALAEENLKAARVLEKAEHYPQAFGLLLYAAEESTKASIYLYAHLNLLTFDSIHAKERRYYNESWLTKHPRKYVEFARATWAGSADAATFLAGLVARLDSEAAESVLGTWFIFGLALQAWSEDFEPLRELAFHSGPPVSGSTDVSRPGRAQCEMLDPLVGGAIEGLADVFSRPLDAHELEKSLPSREGWARFVNDNPQGRDVLSRITQLLESSGVNPPR